MTAELDETIHAPNRLRICAMLSTAQEVEFSVVRDALDVSDSVLSKHVRVLNAAGYLEIRKPAGRGRVRTWLALTGNGRAAYARHVSALRALLALDDRTAPSTARVAGTGTASATT